MRKALNENPVIQVVALGALGIFVVFIFMTRVMGGSTAEEAPTTAATTPSASTTPDPATSDPTTADPSAVTPAPAAGETPPPAEETPLGFEPGVGLPTSVVTAYEGGDVVALLVVKEQGSVDKKLIAEAQRLRSRGDTTVFVIPTENVARYSRIASGVDLDRTPALVVITPKQGAQNGLPTATVTYGFRGTDSLEQAVRDSLYEGKQLPYHPG